MKDDVGIPHAMFGDVPERFYALLGRITALGAHVERTAGDVALRLNGLTERALIGGTWVDVRQRLGQSLLHASDDERHRFAQLVSRADEAMRLRSSHLVGWRSERDEAHHLGWAAEGEAKMRALVAELVAVVEGFETYLTMPLQRVPSPA